jgi:hypothetical protein
VAEEDLATVMTMPKPEPCHGEGHGARATRETASQFQLIMGLTLNNMYDISAGDGRDRDSSAFFLRSAFAFHLKSIVDDIERQALYDKL